MARKKQKQNAKTWKAYVDYLEEYNRRTDWVWRDHPYPEYHQHPEEKRDFREEIDDRLRAEKVMEVLMTLTDRERKILIHRFGIGDGVPKTLEWCSQLFSVGRERIRHLEARALRKLRHPKRTKAILEEGEYDIRMRVWCAKERQEIAEAQARLDEENKKREERAAQWKRQQDERAREEAIAREERYRERQRKAAERYQEYMQQNAEQEAVYAEMKLKVHEYENEQARKIREYQLEQNRPYAWCPRTKTKRYLD